jgi:hypothetical protein
MFVIKFTLKYHFLEKYALEKKQEYVQKMYIAYVCLLYTRSVPKLGIKTGKTA